MGDAVKDIVAGTAGGIALTIVGHPFDTTKVRLQTQPAASPLYSGAIDCVKKTLQWEGVRGLYKGVASPLMGQMFFRASLFLTYGQSTALLHRRLGIAADRRLPAASYFLAGGATGLVASLVEGPLDMMKTQAQMEIVRARSQPGYTPRYRGVVDVARTAYRINGVRTLYHGLLATALRNVPANASYFGFFELMRTQLAARRGEHVSQLPAHLAFASGATAGLLYWVTTYPLDVVKSTVMGDHLDPAHRRHQSWTAAAQHVYRESGWRGFWRGFSPCCLRACIANGTIWLTVLQVKKLLS